jgi:hypothetical protein
LVNSLYLSFMFHTSKSLELSTLGSSHEVDAPIADMSEAFKLNYLRTFNNKVTHYQHHSKHIVSGTPFAITDTFFLTTLPQNGELPDLYSHFAVLRISADNLPDLVTIERELLGILTTADGPDLRFEGKYLLDLVDTPALRLFLDSEHVENIIYEAKILEEQTDTIKIAILKSFYEMCGLILVSIEKQQMLRNIPILDSNVDSSVFSSIATEWLTLYNLNRRFLTRSQSYVQQNREICEKIIEMYRLRLRSEGQKRLNEEASQYLAFLIEKRRGQNAEITAKMLFILTCFTIVASIFFGFLQTQEEAPILKRGLEVLSNFSLLYPLFLGMCTLGVLLLFGWLWPTRR